MDFLTPRRIRNYPRIILAVLWTAILLNWAFSTGWRGWGGQILFIDFIVFYGAGVLFRAAPESLYDFSTQLSVQQSLLATTLLEGSGPFSHPPYVAPLVAAFSDLPLPSALALWTALSCMALVGSIAVIKRLFGAELSRFGISRRTLVAIALSSAPIAAGLYSGQMHSFVLFGTLGVIALILTRKPWTAGLVAGLLATKPQLAVSFGLLFLARGELSACIAAALAFAGLNAILVATSGWATAFALYSDYFTTTGSLLLLPFQSGFPRYLLMTPYGFLTGLTGIERQGAVFFISNVLAAGFLAWFVHDAWQLRRKGEDAIRLSLGRALLLPFLLTPYWMMYDAASLLLACPLLGRRNTPRLLTVGSAIYVWLWVFPLLSGLIGVPLGVLAPVALWIYSEGQYRSINAASMQVDATRLDDFTDRRRVVNDVQEAPADEGWRRGVFVDSNPLTSAGHNS